MPFFFNFHANTDRLSFGVGRLVGSPLSRSPRRSPSHSPCPDSPRTDHQDTEVDVDAEDEEIDVDVEEVGEEDDHEGSSPPRSASPPSPPAITRHTPSSNPPRRFAYFMLNAIVIFFIRFGWFDQY